MHDVGKLTLDEQLINKPSQRNRMEEQLWRQHPAIGAQMTADVLDADSANWIRWHHERADGRGYPDRLTAEELPEGAALLALADAWDHLVFGAPGQQARTVEEAFEICVAQQGSHFTPEAIEALRLVLAADAAERAALDAQALPVRELYTDAEPDPLTSRRRQGDPALPTGGDS
jgi:HD-GYP domain-containing protein (c-di-GMP phosphodiesterase class II)